MEEMGGPFDRPPMPPPMESEAAFSSAPVPNRPTNSGKSGSQPPHSLESERSILGAILIQNEAIDRVREVGLQVEDFYRADHQKIYEAALSLADRHEPVDLVTLSAALKARGHFEAVGGTPTLTQLFEDAFAVGNVGQYARIVRDQAVQRNMISVCSEIIGEAVKGVQDTEAFLDEAESKVFGLSQTRVESSVTELKNVVTQNMQMIEELAARSSDVTGMPTGFTDFDRRTTGLHPGQVMIVAARPGMGKTSWILSAIQHAAIAEKGVIGLFSLEMSKEEIGFRFLSGLSRIDSRRLKVGKIHDHDWRQLAESADHLSKARVFIDDSGGVSVLDIRSRCRRLMSIEKKLDLVVVDYLQLMKGTRGARGEQNREREISEISRGLKELAKELKVPIIALSQLNRGVEMRQDKRPTLADLRESGAIEQDADLVCFIHREEYYNKETEDKGIAEFITAKNRSGETGTDRLAWLGQYTLFANLSDSGPDEAFHGGPSGMPPGMPVDPPNTSKGDITL